MNSQLNNQQRDLIRKIYTFFPKGLHDQDEGYYATQEYLNWSSKMQTIPARKIAWEKLHLDIKQHVNDVIIEDFIEKCGVDNGMRAIIILKSSSKEEIDLVMNISILLPYFIFHQSIQTQESKTVHNGSYNNVSFSIPQAVIEDYLIICELIKKHFYGYQELDVETALIELDNIVYQGTGLLEDWDSDILEKLTIYNALFSTNYL